MTDYHVKTTGVDGDHIPGTDANPWASIQNNVHRLKPGDTMYVHAGTYYDSSVYVRVHGAEAQPITIRNWGSDVVWLDAGSSHTPGVNTGNPPGKWEDAPINKSTTPWTQQKTTNYVNIQSSYIVWDGINLKNSAGRLMNIYGNRDTGKVENVIVRNTIMQWARNSVLVVQIWDGVRPRNITIENCEITQWGMFYPANRSVSTANHPGGATFNGVDGLVFCYNKVHDGWGEGILFDTVRGGSRNGHFYGNEIYSTMRSPVYLHAALDVIFEQNVSYQIDGSDFRPSNCISLQASENPLEPVHALENVIIRNNLFYADNNNYYGTAYEAVGIRMAGNTDGWQLGSRFLPRPPIKNMHIYNNTAVVRGTSAGAIALTVLPQDDIFIRGNIFIQKGTGPVCSKSQFINDYIFSHNAFNKTPPSVISSSTDVVDNDLGLVDQNGEPLAGNFNLSDFGLRADSIVKDNSWIQPSGVSQWLYYRDDYNGDGRGESSWSRGALQYDPDAPPDPPDPPDPTQKDVVFVATDGDDSTGDGEELTPYATVNYAQQFVNPGGTIYIRGGTYSEIVTVYVSGLVGERTTITAYQGETVVFDGQAPLVEEGGISGEYLDYSGDLPAEINAGLPSGTPLKVNPVNGAYFVNESMWVVNGSYLDIVDIAVTNSMGKGWRVFPASGSSFQIDVSLIRCRSINSRASGVAVISNDYGVRPNRIEIRDGHWENSGCYNPTPRDAEERTAWVPAILVHSTDDCYVVGNYITRTWGEGFVGDSQARASSQLSVVGNWFVDDWKACRIHGAQTAFVMENVLFRTGVIDYVEPLITIQSTQRPVGDEYWGNGVESTDITVCNNLLLDGKIGLAVYGTTENPMMRRVHIFNNTILGQDLKGVVFDAYNYEDIYFRNNIIKDSPTLIEMSGNFPTGLIHDYNLYGVDPGITLGGNDVIGDPLLVDDTYRPDEQNNLSLTQFDLTDTSPALSSAYNYYEDNGVNNDIIQRTRPDGTEDAWDIGAFEFNDTDPEDPDNKPKITASFTVDVTSGPAPLTVQFTDTSVVENGAEITEHLWYISYNVQLGGATPQYTFTEPGVYQVRLIAIDDVNNVTDDTYVLIYVREADPVAGEDIKLEVVEHYIPSGTTVINIPHTLGVVPDLCRVEAMFGNEFGYMEANAEMCIGAYDGTDEFFNWAYADYGSYITAIRRSGSGNSLYMRGGVYGAITMDASNITITFSASTPMICYVKLVIFGGDDFEAKVGVVTPLETGELPVSVGFDPSCVDIFSTFTSNETNRAHLTMVMGRIGTTTQGAVAMQIANNTYPLEIITGVYDTYCLINPLYTSYYATGALSVGGFSLTTNGNADPHRQVSYIAMKFGTSSVDVHAITTWDDPSDLQEILYPTPYSYIMAEILVAGRDIKNNFSSNKTNNKGLGRLTVIDSDSSHIVMSDNQGDSSYSKGVTGVASNFLMPLATNPTLTVFSAAPTVSNIGLLLDWVSADNVAYYALLTSVEKRSTLPDFPQALFEVGKYRYVVGENIELVNLSSENSVTYLWTFGDTTTSLDETPTKSYTDPGIYTISLEVSNANGSTLFTIADAVEIVGNPPTVDFTAVPSSGESPLSSVLTDASAPGVGGTILEWYWQMSARSAFSGTPGEEIPDVLGEGFDKEADSYYEELQQDVAPISRDFTQIGEHVVRLSVKQDDGQWYQKTVIAITVNPNLPGVSFTSVSDTGTPTVPSNYTFTDTTDLYGQDWVSSAWNISGPGVDITYNDIDRLIYFFDVPGTWTITLTVTSEAGSDSAQEILVLTQDDDCLIGPTTPLIITTTSQNEWSNAGHTHEIVHSNRPEPNTIVSYDGRGWTGFSAIGTAALPKRHSPFPENLYEGNDFPEVLSPITNAGYVQTDGVMNNAGQLIIRAFKEIVLQTVAQRILPLFPNTERLGSAEVPFLSMFVSNLEAALISNINRVTGSGGDIIVGKVDATMTILNDSEDISYVIVRRNIFSAGDTLLLTDGSNFEYLSVKSLKEENTPVPLPPYDPTGGVTDDSEFVEEPVTGTLYVVDRGVHGSDPLRWLAGTTIINLGKTGDVHIELYGSHSLENREAASGPTGAGDGPAIAVKELGSLASRETTFVTGMVDDKYGVADPTNMTAIGKEDEPHVIVMDGNIHFKNLPTSNPGGSGILWNDGGVLKIT